MSKTLGLDLGANSIGWAIVENENLLDCGVRIFSDQNETRLNETNFFKQAIDWSLLKTNQIVLISALFFSLTLMNFKNWQFWLGLSVASILTYLSKDKNSIKD